MLSLRHYQQLWRLVTPAAVALCSVFAANALAHVVSETVLPEKAMSAPVMIEPRVAESTLRRSKDATPIVARNMFCSSCLPEIMTTESHDTVGIATHLPLRLIATNISSQESRSFASVLNTESLRQGAYRMGENIPEAGIVRRIGRDYVEFRAESAGRVERVQFDTGWAKTVSIAAKRASANRGGGSLAEEFVRAISDTHFEVDRELIGKIRGNPRLAGARALPLHKKGVMVGVRVSAVRTKELAHAMGLRSGDTILGANGVKLTSVEAGLELLGQLGTRDHWSFEIERSGEPVRLLIDLQ